MNPRTSLHKAAAATLAGLALSACGTAATTSSSSTTATTAAAATTASATQTQASAAPTPAPTIPEALSYARGALATYEAKLRTEGVDMFGRATVKCAPTDGPETECVVNVPFRRLDRCARGEADMFIENGPAGPGLSSRPGNGTVRYVPQVCYIGPNGQPVPSNPNG